MRINRITIENFQGAGHRPAPTPLALIAGHNFQGKSSIAEAVRLAFGVARARRPEKEYGMLVSDGAKLGAVAIELEDGLVSFALPKGTAEGQDIIPNSVALPFVLAPERFAQADANERRNVLFTLTGAKIKPEDIANRLLARGCDAGLVTQIKHPAHRLRAGAKQQATQAKGAWRAATGETYGEKKARWACRRRRSNMPSWSAPARSWRRWMPRSDRAVAGPDHAAGGGHAAARDHIAARQARAARLPELQRNSSTWRNTPGRRRMSSHWKPAPAPALALVHDPARCHDAYNIEDISFKLPAELDGRILKAFVAYEAQYGSLMPPAATRKHPPPCRRRSKPATSWPAASRTTAATLPPQKKPPRTGRRRRARGDRAQRRRRRARPSRRPQGRAQGRRRPRPGLAQRQAGGHQRDRAHDERRPLPPRGAGLVQDRRRPWRQTASLARSWPRRCSPSTTVWRTCPPKRTGRPWQSAPTWRSPTAAAPTGCCRSPSAGASTRS